MGRNKDNNKWSEKTLHKKQECNLFHQVGKISLETKKKQENILGRYEVGNLIYATRIRIRKGE